jgi:hypothetical protein
VSRLGEGLSVSAYPYANLLFSLIETLELGAVSRAETYQQMESSIYLLLRQLPALRSPLSFTVFCSADFFAEPMLDQFGFAG